jgi:hypothetical protein
LGLSVSDVELCVYQGRWFSDEINEYGVRFTPWVDIDQWEYLSMLEQIEQGKKYQVRILKQIDIRGFAVKDPKEHPDVLVNPGI